MAGPGSKAVHLYVDACHEESSEMPAGLGGILVFPESNKRRFFSKMMDATDVALWNLTESEKPIYELEMLAIVSAVDLWADHVSGMSVLIFFRQ